MIATTFDGGHRMTALTKEQIEEWRKILRHNYSENGATFESIDALCEMALRSRDEPHFDAITSERDALRDLLDRAQYHIPANAVELRREISVILAAAPT